MHASVSINIAQPKAVVWQAICDIEHSNTMIGAILAIEILHQPTEGLIGLKWRETRKMFGKEATEVMWVTKAEDNHYYATRAENHGAVYILRLSLVDLEVEATADSTAESARMTQLTMTFHTESQSRLGKILASCMGFFMKGSMQKMLNQDLVDIKHYVEKT